WGRGLCGGEWGVGSGGWKNQNRVSRYRSISHSPPPTAHSLPRPWRLLLLQERAHAALPFFAHTTRGDCVDRVRNRVDQRMRCDMRDQLLALPNGFGAGRLQHCDRLRDCGIEVVDDAMDEPDPLRALRVESFT